MSRQGFVTQKGLLEEKHRKYQESQNHSRMRHSLAFAFPSSIPVFRDCEQTGTRTLIHKAWDSGYTWLELLIGSVQQFHQRFRGLTQIAKFAMGQPNPNADLTHSKTKNFSKLNSSDLPVVSPEN